MKYCISISVCIFYCMKITEMKLSKMPIIQTDFRLYEQTPRHRGKRYQLSNGGIFYFVRQ